MSYITRNIVSVKETLSKPMENPLKTPFLNKKVNQDVPLQKMIYAMPNTSIIDFTKMPRIIFVIGGPGSNKTILCMKAVGANSDWGHFR